MLNNDIKTTLIKLIFQNIVSEKQVISWILEEIVLLGYNEYFEITKNSAHQNNNLKSNQE